MGFDHIRAALMPPRPKRDRRRRSAQVTPEAIALFRQGVDLQRGPHDPAELRDLKIALAAALGRSKFRACPLDSEPRSLIGCDTEPSDVVIELHARLSRRLSSDLSCFRLICRKC